MACLAQSVTETMEHGEGVAMVNYWLDCAELTWREIGQFLHEFTALIVRERPTVLIVCFGVSATSPKESPVLTRVRVAFSTHKELPEKLPCCTPA